MSYSSYPCSLVISPVKLDHFLTYTRFDRLQGFEEMFSLDHGTLNVFLQSEHGRLVAYSSHLAKNGR